MIFMHFKEDFEEKKCFPGGILNSGCSSETPVVTLNVSNTHKTPAVLQKDVLLKLLMYPLNFQYFLMT